MPSMLFCTYKNHKLQWYLSLSLLLCQGEEESFMLKSCTRRKTDSIEKRFCFDVEAVDRSVKVWFDRMCLLFRPATQSSFDSHQIVPFSPSFSSSYFISSSGCKLSLLAPNRCNATPMLSILEAFYLQHFCGLSHLQNICSRFWCIIWGRQSAKQSNNCSGKKNF